MKQPPLESGQADFFESGEDLARAMRERRRQNRGVQPDKRVDLRPEDVSFASVTSIGPICLYCRHFHGMATPGLTCDAFPTDIPRAIWFNQADHRQPFAGDHGVRFAGATADNVRQADRVLKMARLGGPLPEDIKPVDRERQR